MIKIYFTLVVKNDILKIDLLERVKFLKNTKICPKCNSNEIVKAKYGFNKGPRNTIFTKGLISGAVFPTMYICCKCGYLEEWIENEHDLVKIINTFKN
ncbi:MAG: hypothetical protein K0Q49_161 [Haloplasmataceae bacterium]|jgi:ribosomal protein S27AE|nr:hypothetical protein [Haloplasmataceae bacterium]